MAKPAELSARDARRIAVSCQGLAGPRPKGGPAGVLDSLRAVQLDTISVLARSHELVAYSRLGSVQRVTIEKAYWADQPHRAFEYWSHAACVIPMSDWPNYEWKRQAIRNRGHRWHRLEDADSALPAVLGRLANDGPLTANQLGGAKRGGVWWDWSETKIAVEWLLDIGEVVCCQRRGFQRVYDLPERAIPSDLRNATTEPVQQKVNLVLGAAEAMGVATARDLAAYTGMRVAEIPSLVTAAGLTPTAVEGWAKPAWMSASVAARGRLDPPRRTAVMLSPFDSLIWERDRMERLFGMIYRLEAYTPKAKRVYGYCCLPVLAGGELVARVDPGRDGKTLVGKGVHLEQSVMASRKTAGPACLAVASALWQAASWVGSDSVRVDWVTPEDARGPVLQAVSALADNGNPALS